MKGGEEVRFGAMSPKLADLAYMLGQANDVDFNIIMAKGGKGVMNGVTAGDMDLGWMAGIQAKGVAAGDLVNLASGLSKPLAQTPDAPTMADMGVQYTADGYFMFAGPGGMDSAAREALTNAISAIVNDPSTKDQLVTRAFGGPTVIVGGDLDALLAMDEADARKLLEAASQ